MCKYRDGTEQDIFNLVQTNISIEKPIIFTFSFVFDSNLPEGGIVLDIHPFSLFVKHRCHALL